MKNTMKATIEIDGKKAVRSFKGFYDIPYLRGLKILDRQQKELAPLLLEKDLDKIEDWFFSQKIYFKFHAA